MSRILPYFGSRSCFVAGLAFAITSLVSFQLGARLALASMSPWGVRASLGEAFLTGVLVGFGLPFIAGLLALIVVPFRENARPAASAYARNIATWLVALVLGPATFVSLLAIGDAKAARANAELMVFNARPIVASDGPGLCAPPEYGSENGVLTVRLTARFPTAGLYGFYFRGKDAAGQDLMGFERVEFPAGVQSVTLKTRREWNTPIPDPVPPLHITWPVTVKELSVRALPHTAKEQVEWKDIRVADSLTVVSEP